MIPKSGNRFSDKIMRRQKQMTRKICRMRRWLCLLPILVACEAFAQPAADESAADFYRGKSLNIVVGHEAGTGYDFFGRTLSRHITRHLAGNPGVTSGAIIMRGSAIAVW